jgi:hypothetical protein
MKLVMTFHTEDHGFSAALDHQAFSVLQGGLLVVALCAPRFFLHLENLLHFALYAAFLRSDYYWRSVTLGLSAFRSSRVPSVPYVLAMV